MYMPPLPKNRFLRGIYLMVQRYLRHDVGIHSAALAFYLLFTIFPFLIFISALLGLLHLDVAEILQALREILPLEIVDFIDVYLTYVGENSSLRLMLFGLFFSIYFPARQPTPSCAPCASPTTWDRPGVPYGSCAKR